METKKTVAAAMLIGFSAVLSACSKVDSIITRIDEKNYSEALDEFSSSKLSDTDATELCEQMKQRIEDSLSKYAMDEITKADVNDILTTAYYMDIGDMLSYVSTANARLNTLTLSKQAYQTGVEDSTVGKWASAYKAFSKVVEGDHFYERAREELSKCVEGYCNEVEQKVNEYTIKDDYSGAMSYLNNLKKKEDPFCEDVRVFVNNKVSEVAIPYIKSLYEDDISKYRVSVFRDLNGKISEYGLEDNQDIVSFVNDLADKYMTEIRAQVASKTEENNYNDAIDYLENIKAYKNVPDVIIEYCNETIESLKIESVISKAKESVTGNDIASALKTISDYKIENNISENKELDEYADFISKEYINTILTKVAKLREEENYAAALNMLNKASEIVQNDEIARQIEEINAIKPVYLSDLKISKSNRFSLRDTGEALEDTVGNKYEVGNLFEISSTTKEWSDPDIGSVDYNLGYQYTTLSGTVAVDDISKDTSGVLKIKGDDVVLYSVKVSRKMTPVSIKVDVSTVDWLNISLESPNNGEIDVILANFKFTDDPVEKNTELIGEDSDAVEEKENSDTSELGSDEAEDAEENMKSSEDQ